MKEEESRKEKLARLLAENKTRLARDKLVSRYRQEMSYQAEEMAALCGSGLTKS